MSYTALCLHKVSGTVLRFSVVGALSNIILYMLYLLITFAGVEYKAAMTVLFVVGCVQTFFVNRLWTFKDQGMVSSKFIKYFLIYFFAYIFNFLALLVLSDVFGYPHYIVQLLVVLMVAVLLYFLQKYWIFR